VVGAGSCDPSDVGRGVPDAGGKTFARLAVVLTTARDGNDTVGAVGRLLRYRGVDRESAQVLAGAHERETAASASACVQIDEEAQLDDALSASPPDAIVQMLDAGELVVRIAGQMVKMAPRYVPELVPFVSGVVYQSDVLAVDGSAELGGRDDAFIAASGGQQVGRFVTVADVPAAPRLLTVGGINPDVAAASVEPGGDLAVAWTPDGSARASVTLVVSRETGPALRCRVADSGRFTIPAGALARTLDAAHGDPVGLAVERSRKTLFSAAGLEAAEVEVTVRDVVPLRY
jgi:hypothetical protein